MKVIGLMITYNEIHFIKYSLPNLLNVCDRVVVVDNSTDGTLEYLEQFNNVFIFKESWVSTPLTYKERRQLALNIGRELGGTHFIVIDADEVMSNELMERLSNGFNDALYCHWYHINGDLWTATNDYVDEIQGIAFKDIGINYHGKELVHEDKIPIGRDESFTIIDEALLHFGTADKVYANTKRAYYKCLELLEGVNIHEINMKYINNMSVELDLHNKFTYPPNINNNILLMDDMTSKYLHRIVELVSIDPIQYYPLDIWRIPNLEQLCIDTIINFDANLIVYNKKYTKTRLALLFALYHGKDLIKRGECKRIIGFIYWKLTGRCLK